MSHQSASRSFATRSDVRRPVTETGPELTFMLAHQATNRLRLELSRLEDAAGTSRDPGFAHYEASIAIDQVEALADRLRPFTAFIDQAIRFEAQEILAALDSIRHRLGSVCDRLEPNRGRAASDVAARLMRRRA